MGSSKLYFSSPSYASSESSFHILFISTRYFYKFVSSNAKENLYLYIYINPSCIHHDTFILPSQTIEALSAVPSPELALRLYLQCAEVCHGLLWVHFFWVPIHHQLSSLFLSIFEGSYVQCLSFPFSGCKRLRSRTCCIRVLYSSIYIIRGRSLSKCHYEEDL